MTEKKTNYGPKILATNIDELIEALEEIRDREGNLHVEDEKGINQVRVRVIQDINDYRSVKVY